MAPDILLKNFPLLMDAPNSVQKMRKLILQMAVQGKLVPQDTNDEPASELLKQIKAEKDRFIKEGKIKKSKKLKPLENFEISFDLPDGWCLANIPNVVTFDKYAIKRGPFGSSIKKAYFVPHGFKVYEQKNAIYDDFSIGNYYINEEKFNELKAFEVKPNDIIISCSGTVGKVAIAPEGMERGVINQALLKLTLNTDALLNEYFKILFPAYLMGTTILSDLKGTAQKNIVSVEVLKRLPFPLPPLAEQKRIVAKVNQLMAFCDDLEAHQQKAVDKRTQLNDSVIDNLLAAQNVDEFADHWQLICDNFDLLYDDSENFAKLRKAILQLAVQGKLVPQDTNDEPAAELLKKIEQKKAKYIDENQIRVPKFKPALDDKLPFKLPSNWEWANFNTVVTFITDYQANGSFATLKKNVNYYNDPNYAVLVRLKDLRNVLMKVEDFVYTDEHGYKFLSKSFLHGGEILVANVGAGVGTLVYAEKDKPATLAPNMFKIIISELMDKNYFKYFSQSPLYWGYIKQLSGGTGQPKINKNEYKSIKIPVPPLSEQKRISEKVDQLMPICDELEARLNQSQYDSDKLLDAVLYETLAA